MKYLKVCGLCLPLILAVVIGVWVKPKPQTDGVADLSWTGDTGPAAVRPVVTNNTGPASRFQLTENSRLRVLNLRGRTATQSVVQPALTPDRAGAYGTVSTPSAAGDRSFAWSGPAPMNTVASPGLLRLDSRPGSKVRIEGTSNIHDWQVEGKLIGGYLLVGPTFPLVPGQRPPPGRLVAGAEAFIPVRSLISVDTAGRPYSSKMDDIMYEKLKAGEFGRIQYRLQELVLKEAATNITSSHQFEATGALALAGVTNQVRMPVRIQPLGDNQLRISAEIGFKMTDFGIEPPAPTVSLGLIRTGDAITLRFDWVVGRKHSELTQSSPAVAGE